MANGKKGFYNGILALTVAVPMTSVGLELICSLQGLGLTVACIAIASPCES